jgi:diacylglycerol O-acyltransferase / wax synthase
MSSSERLSAIEASFVGLEQPGMPMHVAGLVIFKGSKPVTMRELRRLATSRLKGIIRFRQRVRTTFPGGRLVWEPAGPIRQNAHVFHHVLLPPGRDSQLHQLCAAIHEQPLDRSRPLWQLHLIDGLSGGRQALLMKTHHALTDGLAGMEAAEMLFDPAPNQPRPQVPVMRFAQNCSAPSQWAVVQGLLGLTVTVVGGPLAIEGPFNGHVSGQRAFGTATLSMAEVSRVKRSLGVSVDDVLAATVATGIGRYLRDTRYPEIPEALRAMLPVSTRRAGKEGGVRNDVTAVFIDLPIDTDDLRAIAVRIRSSKTRLRTAHAVRGSSMAVEAAGLLPAPLHRALLGLISDLPFANLILSDVPGPKQHLYFLGRRISACYPMMPLSRNVGLSIAAISMGGAVGIGVTADPSLVPDAQRLADAIEEAWTAFAGGRVESHRSRRAA